MKMGILLTGFLLKCSSAFFYIKESTIYNSSVPSENAKSIKRTEKII